MIPGFEAGPGWWVLLFGWPAVVGASVALSFAAIRRSRGLAIIGCLLASPLLVYLSLTPRFYWAAPVALGLLWVLAWRIRVSGWHTNVFLALPSIILILWLAYAVPGR